MERKNNSSMQAIHEQVAGMREIASAKLVVQRSRFHAHVFLMDPKDGEDAIKEVLKQQRRDYKKADHHCWAARFGGTEMSKDDGEVGHPGKVILEVIRGKGLDNHIIVVSRIFGGVKLGVGGVSRAFREAAELAVGAIEK